MAGDAQSFDSDIFQSAAALFLKKRSVLPVQTVKGFAAEVVQRIVLTAANASVVEDTNIGAQRLEEFCDVLLQPFPAKALAYTAALQAEGVTPQVLRYGYLAGAARLLGERWDRDEVTFMDVTVATGHLYALLRAIRSEPHDHNGAQSGIRSALFASVPGENHTLGITLAADTFRDQGWDIDLRIAESHDRLVTHVQTTRPAVIGLSLSTKERLADLIRLVLALRIVVPRAIIGVAPGLDISDEEIFGIVDIDIAFRDARHAVMDLERLARLRG